MKRFFLISGVFLHLLLLISCSHSLRNVPVEKDGMITIPGGIFRIGPEEAEMNTRVAHDVSVGEFMIDKYEVSAKEFAAVGDSLEAVVLSCDSRERRISLSIKSMHAAVEKAEMASYMGSQGEATSNLGDLLKQGFENKNNN
jgi:hypothetical protein